MVIHAELHGFRKRWAASSNREIPGDISCPAEAAGSELGRASEEPRLEEDTDHFDLDLQSDDPPVDSGSSHISQMSTQQTGVVTALSILRSAKRVKLP